MLILGGYRLRVPALGWDENATYIVSQRSASEIVHTAANNDGVIAPYYLFMHFWTAAFGTSELALRAPSLIGVTIGVGLVGELGRRLFTPGVGLVGGLMLVTIPQLSRYAQDARTYGLTFMFAMLATLLLYRALERPTWLRWIGYGACLMMLGLAHMLGLLLLAGHAYAVAVRWWRGRDRELLRWVGVTIVAVLPALPLVFLGLTQRDGQLHWIAPLTGRDVLSAPGDLFLAVGVGWFMLGLAFAGQWRKWRAAPEFVVAVVVPPAALLAASFLSDPIWVPRYAMYVLGPVALLAAAALHGLRLRSALALAVLAVIALPAQVQLRGPATHHGPSFRQITGIISANQLPGDGIVYASGGKWSLRAGVNYYLAGKSAPRDLLLYRSAAQVGRLNAEECRDTAACVGDTNRIWLIRLWQSDDPLSGAGPVQPILRDQYRRVEMWKIPKATIALYERS